MRNREAAKPFLKLRQKRYLEILHIAAILSDSKDSKSYAETEIKAAKKRFRELYVAELSMVESEEVESCMVELAKEIDPELAPPKFTPTQRKAYDLAHALRDSFVKSWGIK